MRKLRVRTAGSIYKSIFAEVDHGANRSIKRDVTTIASKSTMRMRETENKDCTINTTDGIRVLLMLLLLVLPPVILFPPLPPVQEASA